MIPYASRTGTRRNLAALRSAGWRLLVSARGCLRSEGFRYALDNGAWTSFQRAEPFDVPAFERALSRMGAGADWCVVPDIVAGGLESLSLSLQWIDRVLSACPVALVAVQDGMRPDDVRSLLGSRVGLFVGGSTPWKLSTLESWCDLGRELGCVVHVGRVNSAKRIALCVAHGATSFDGTSASRFAKTIPLLDNARRQLAMEFRQ